MWFINIQVLLSREAAELNGTRIGRGIEYNAADFLIAS